MNVIQSIYNKLKPKTELKTHAVNLNKVDEVFNTFEVAGYEVGENFDDLFNSGRDRILEARDIMRNELNDFYTKRAELQDLKDQLDEMGVPYPEKIIELIDFEEGIVNKINENHAEFEALGMAPMFDRR